MNASWSNIRTVGSLPRLLAVVIFATTAWANAQTTEASTPPPAAAATKAETFELPGFATATMPAKSPEQTPVSAPAPEGAPELINGKQDADDALSTVPNSEESTNKISVGDIIVSPKQKLYHQAQADIRFEEVPVRDALRYLAEAAGINYILPDIETDKITINMRMAPFKAMETIANNFGLGLYEEGDLWFIRKKDKAEYFAKIYKLKNIHLGESSSGSGVDSDDDDDDDDDTSTTSSTTDTTTTSTVSSSGGGGVVMTTLMEILGIDAKFGGTIGADGTTSGGSQENNSSSDADNTEKTSDYTYVSYDADANTLFIIATATQHSWVSEYVNAIDNPTANIAIEAMFLETSKSPTEVMGMDWEGASSMAITMTGEIDGDDTSSAGDTISLGSLDNIKFPTGGLIETNTFSWGLRAFAKDTDSQIARYPSVVTQNGREVKIETTQKIPLSATERVVSATTGDTTTVGIVNLGTQDIGTTITITPRQINEQLVQLQISINISTAAASGADENTNRVATNETSYEGTVNVPVGFTLAIGGLERIQEEISSKKMPGLGDIPLFGFIFKDTGKTFNKANVYMFITPTVLDNKNPDNAFLRRSEGLSRDWIEKADAKHRAWRRNSVDPRVDEDLKKANKQ